jgi:acyl-CoA dehydrogenase
MSWDFSTDPDYQEKLDWVDTFVTEEIEPIDILFPSSSELYDRSTGVYDRLVRPLQEQVKSHGLWAAHLTPELGGMGMGNVQLALLNEILGRSMWAPSVFGTQAPDSGNAEILAHHGTAEQKDRFLKPLLAGDTVSTYAMTEQQGGSDPGGFTCQAVRDGDEWVINGEKWFASNYPYAAFVIAMTITNPDVPVHRGSSMLLIPAGTHGMEEIRITGLGAEPLGEGAHGYIRFSDCRVPADSLLGDEGGGFKLAQERLGGGRLHHAMRTIGQLKRTFDMMCEFAVSRSTQGSLLGKKQAVQQAVADSWIQIEQFRMQVLHASWICDQLGYDEGRRYISAVKAAMPAVVNDVVYRAMHLHGALGVSNEMPFVRLWQQGPVMATVDGGTEIHKDVLARQALKDYTPFEGDFPSQHLPGRVAAAKAKFGGTLDGLIK